MTDKTARRIRAEWEAAGRPPCPLCRCEIRDGDETYASRLVDTVIHALCSPGPGAYQRRPDRCTMSTDFCRIPRFCPCPTVSVVNQIIAAHFEGRETALVRTKESPGCERAAREAGLGAMNMETEDEWRDSQARAAGLGKPVSEAPARWYEPPERLAVDVPESIRQGRIVAAAPQAQSDG